MKKRETFSSRLGFILVSAGCAVGIGNVWKFPYICGKFGGAAFILIYLLFLAILGFPILVCEFAVGRSSRKSCASSFQALGRSRYTLAVSLGRQLIFVVPIAWLLSLSGRLELVWLAVALAEALSMILAIGLRRKLVRDIG